MSKNRKTAKRSQASKPRSQSGPPEKKKRRDYQHEYQLQKQRGEHKRRMERQRLRRKFDSKHGRSARAGLDLSHDKALAEGGSNADGYRLENRSTNRARGGAMSKPGTRTGKGKNKNA